MGGEGGGSTSAVFYAEKYHPIQAGRIDGTDVAPHDNAILRALCSSAGLYDPFGDPKATGDPYCTLFIGRLSRQTDNETIRKVLSGSSANPNQKRKERVESKKSEQRRQVKNMKH